MEENLLKIEELLGSSDLTQQDRGLLYNLINALMSDQESKKKLFTYYSETLKEISEYDRLKSYESEKKTLCFIYERTIELLKITKENLYEFRKLVGIQIDLDDILPKLTKYKSTSVPLYVGKKFKKLNQWLVEKRGQRIKNLEDRIVFLNGEASKCTISTDDDIMTAVKLTVRRSFPNILDFSELHENRIHFAISNYVMDVIRSNAHVGDDTLINSAKFCLEEGIVDLNKAIAEVASYKKSMSVDARLIASGNEEVKNLFVSVIESLDTKRKAYQ